MQNAPSVSREKKKNFTTVGGMEERAESGAYLAMACFVYFWAQQKTTWDSYRAFFPTSSKASLERENKPPSVTKNPKVKCKYHPATLVGGSGEAVWLRPREMQGCCTRVNEERIKDPVRMGKGGFK